jgi:hypothetical protein
MVLLKGKAMEINDALIIIWIILFSPIITLLLMDRIEMRKEKLREQEQENVQEERTHTYGYFGDTEPVISEQAKPLFHD